MQFFLSSHLSFLLPKIPIHRFLAKLQCPGKNFICTDAVTFDCGPGTRSGICHRSYCTAVETAKPERMKKSAFVGASVCFPPPARNRLSTFRCLMSLPILL